MKEELTAYELREILTELVCRKHEVNDWYLEYREELSNYRIALSKRDRESSLDYLDLQSASNTAYVSVYWYKFFSVEMGVKQIVFDCLETRRRSEIIVAEKLLKDVAERYINRDKVDVDTIMKEYNDLGPILQRYFVTVLTKMNKIMDNEALIVMQESVLYYLHSVCSETGLRGGFEDLVAYAV